MGKLFGTDGIRGRAFEFPVTEVVAERLGAAVVRVLGGAAAGKRVLVGRDTRESGGILEKALVRGLVAAGAEVLPLGVVPTPALAFLVRDLGAMAAVMITASHNPYEDNGMKIFAGDGFKLPDEQEAEIEKLLLEESPVAGAEEAGRVLVPQGEIERYVESALASLGGVRLDGLKVVVDAGHGAGHELAAEIFRRAGAEVLATGDTPDGRNINAGVGALHPGAAGRLVRESGADLGVSLDGDGDRIILSDGEGEVLSGDRALAVCALGLKRAGRLAGNRIVATVMSNPGLDEAMAAEGIETLRAGVGDRLVMERMRAEGISFGGENSGHLIFMDHATTGDGIVSGLQVCKLMKDSGKSLRELAGVMREYPSRLVNLPVRDQPPIDSLPRLRALMEDADGVFGKQGRHLIRYSGTEKKIRVLVEHKDDSVVDEWVRKFSEVIGEEIG